MDELAYEQLNEEAQEELSNGLEKGEDEEFHTQD